MNWYLDCDDGDGGGDNIDGATSLMRLAESQIRNTQTQQRGQCGRDAEEIAARNCSGNCARRASRRGATADKIAPAAPLAAARRRRSDGPQCTQQPARYFPNSNPPAVAASWLRFHLPNRCLLSPKALPRGPN